MYKRLSLIAYLCIIILPFFLNSCDKDEPTASKNEDTSFDEKYQRVVSEMESIQRSLSSASTVDAIMDALKTNPIVKGAVFNEQDSLVMVTLTSGFRMKVDVTAPIPQYITTDDDLKKEELVADSIDSLFSDFDLTDLPHEEVQTKTVPLVRAFNPSGKFLRKRNVLLICFDPEFVMEDKDLMKRSIAAANKESQVGPFSWDYDTITKYTPQYFAKAKQYDFVFISAHGTKDGELFFPVTGMSESLKKTYTKMAESPNTTGVWLATKTIGRREVTTGFWLAKEFFSQYFGEMSHSIVWTSKCYAGSYLSDIRLAFVSHCKVLEFFGASQPCNGGEVGRIFKTYLKFMSKGMSCKDAFWETPKRAEWAKPLKIGTYRRSNDCQWRYATPQATGVKKRLTRAIDDKPADNVTVGVRYRYSVDANNNPINSAEGGIRLTDLQTNTSIDLPMNTENSVIVSSYRIGDNFVISDIDVTLSGLIANHRYRYQAYAKDSETTVVSDQNYEFTASVDNSGPYKIYTREDLIAFMMSSYESTSPIHDRDVILMNDVDLGVFERYYYDYYNKSNNFQAPHDYFSKTFDGQGHTIRIEFKETYSNITHIIKKMRGEMKNLTLDIVGKNLYSPQNLDCVFCEINEGKINNCHINLDINFNPSTSEEFRRVTNLFAFYNLGQINNCSIDGKIIGARAENLIVCYNNEFYSSGGVLKDYDASICNFDVSLQFDGLYFNLIDSNDGVIDNLNLSGDIKAKGPITMIWRNESHSEQTIIKNCTNYANMTSELSSVSGIVYSNSSNVYNCHNKGNLLCSGEKGDASGIASCIYPSSSLNFNPTIKYCTNSGTINSQQDAAGICLRSENYNDYGYGGIGIIENCTNNGKVYAKGYCGGISTSNEGIIRDCRNTASLTTFYEAAGISTLNYYEGKIINCTNSGNIYLDSSSNHGIIDNNDHNNKSTSNNAEICRGCEQLYFGLIHTPSRHSYETENRGQTINCTSNAQVVVPKDRCYKIYPF